MKCCINIQTELSHTDSFKFVLQKTSMFLTYVLAVVRNCVNEHLLKYNSHIFLREMNYIKMTLTYPYFIFKFQSLGSITLHVKHM